MRPLLDHARSARLGERWWRAGARERIVQEGAGRGADEPPTCGGGGTSDLLTSHAAADDDAP